MLYMGLHVLFLGHMGLGLGLACIVGVLIPKMGLE